MINTPLPPSFDLETISHLSKDKLVIIVQQQRVIEQFKQEIERLQLAAH